MVQPFEACLYLVYLAVLLLFSNEVVKHLKLIRNQSAHGCLSAPRHPQWDPFWGADFVLSMARALKEHRYLLWLKSLHAKAPGKTFTINFLGTRTIYTIQPENVKAISVDNWQDFGIGPLRRANKAAMPFADQGASTTDGPEWEFSRYLIKPFFRREAYSNVNRLEKHVNNFMALIPENTTFDIQPLLQRCFLDTATEFIFGESLSSLIHLERAEIAWVMMDVLRGLRWRLQMSRWLWLLKDQRWLDAVAVIHKFIDRHIDRVFEEMGQEQNKVLKSEHPSTGAETERSDLLWSMAHKLKHDRETLRSQILLLFVPNNDTTAIFIGNIFYNLARRPDIYAKVQDEVLSYGNAPLTFETLRSMKYLNSVFNETHRLYPNGITQVRKCLKDTTLPVGGGSDGRSPVFVQKGDVVQVNKSVLHREKSIWGEDAEEFRPERWENPRPMWGFAPFGGGPRRCPAQLQVTVEASYIVARFARRYKAIENRDPMPYTPVMRIGAVNKYGVQIAVVKR